MSAAGPAAGGKPRPPIYTVNAVTAAGRCPVHRGPVNDLTPIGDSMGGALRAAEYGLSRGLAVAREAAASVARPSADGPADYAGAAVRMLEAKAQGGASAAALRTADRVLGSLLDVFA